MEGYDTEEEMQELPFGWGIMEEHQSCFSMGMEKFFVKKVILHMRLNYQEGGVFHVLVW